MAAAAAADGLTRTMTVSQNLEMVVLDRENGAPLFGAPPPGMLRHALRRGWEDFRAAPGFGIVVGMLCILAGWVMIGRFGSISPSATTGVIGNIQAITAVVIWGISLFGGRGSIAGALFGALIVGVFELGLRMAGADPQWTFMLIGLLIIAAVAVDQWIREVAA